MSVAAAAATSRLAVAVVRGELSAKRGERRLRVRRAAVLALGHGVEHSPAERQQVAHGLAAEGVYLYVEYESKGNR